MLFPIRETFVSRIGNNIKHNAYKGKDDQIIYIEGIAPGTTDLILTGPGGLTNALRVTVIKAEIAMDGNRDDEIEFDEPQDARYLFWVNNDHDERHLIQKEFIWVEDDLEGEPDCDNDRIGFNSGAIKSSCKRDLEDFTRIHIRVDEKAASHPGFTYHLKFENVTNNPAVNIFQAISGTSAYLSDTNFADEQIKNSKIITVDTTEHLLPARYIKKGNMVSPFILEGKKEGSGELTLIIKYFDSEIHRKSVALELHKMPWFYDVYSVNITNGTRWEVQMQSSATHDNVGLYKPATNEAFLLVHGWNMTDLDKTQWVETVFKRLWWQGYQGSVSMFSWPTLAEFGFWDVISGGRHFDNSEFISWLSSDALVGVFGDLNSSGNLRVMAHSMGNVVTGEAIHKYGGNKIHTYLACQAAVSGHCYDNKLKNVLDAPDTPNIAGHFPDAVDDAPYFDGNASKVTKRINYMNEKDWALAQWTINNRLKPDNVAPYHFGYDGRINRYDENTDRFTRGILGSIWSVYSVNNERERWIALAYIIESRSMALGQIAVDVRQFSTWNLETQMHYDDEHYSHSKEFRSTISEQWMFWEKVFTDCDFESSVKAY